MGWFASIVSIGSGKLTFVGFSSVSRGKCGGVGFGVGCGVGTGVGAAVGGGVREPEEKRRKITTRFSLSRIVVSGLTVWVFGETGALTSHC